MLETQPTSAIIYRRRRVAAGSIIAIAVLAIVGFFILLGGSDAPSKHDTQEISNNEVIVTPITQISASSGTTATTIISNKQNKQMFVPQCPDSSIALTVSTDKPNYLLGERPVFKALITNASGQRCMRNIGTGMQQFHVLTLTGQHIWSNFDCSFERGMKNQVFEPGQQIGFSLKWLGRTSAPRCPKGAISLAPLGSYQVIASVGTVQSEPVTFNIQ